MSKNKRRNRRYRHHILGVVEIAGPGIGDNQGHVPVRHPRHRSVQWVKVDDLIPLRK